MKEIKERFKLWFLAHETNNFRPKAFQHKCLSFYTFLLITSHYLAFGVAFTGDLIKNPQNFSKEIVSYTNLERQKYGLQTVSEDATLNRAAEDKVRDMLEKNYWDHVSPEGTEAWYFIDQEGYKYTMAGENLAKGFADPKNTVLAWMDSKTHRENLLKPEYRNIGVASANGKLNGQDTSVTVQLFGTEGKIVDDKRVLTLGEQIEKPNISLKNAFETKNIPYVSLWFIIFTFMILDARMLKKLGLHKKRNHKYQLRLLLTLNISLFILLLLGFSYIA